MNYDLTDICNRMLDNADMEIDLSTYPKIKIVFQVQGSMDGKYWHVIFECNETIGLKIENDDDMDMTFKDIPMVLEVSVVTKDTKKVIYIYGDYEINIICYHFHWSLNEVSESEYLNWYT